MKEKGFTMVELVVVIAILLILASIAMPGYINMKAIEKNQYIKAYEKELNIALREFYLENGEKLFYINEHDTKKMVEAFIDKEPTDDTSKEEYRFFQVLDQQSNIYFNEDYLFTYTQDGLFGKIQVKAK